MQENKYLVRLFMVCLFFTLFSFAYLLLPDRPKSEKIDLPAEKPNAIWNNVSTDTVLETNSQEIQTTTNTLSESPKKSETTTQTTTTTTNTTTTDSETNNPISATIEINNQKYNLKLKESSTVYDALQQLTNDKKNTIVMKEFKGMGYFVDEINGIKNDNQNNKYWIYYINGQSAKMGISSYVLKNNDLITWKYEASKF